MKIVIAIFIWLYIIKALAESLYAIRHALSTEQVHWQIRALTSLVMVVIGLLLLDKV